MDKIQWHKKYKQEAFEYFNEKCQNCQRWVGYVQYGVIHHNTYKHEGGIYNATFKELVELNKVTFVCNECHEEIHSNVSIDGITRILNVNCEGCGVEIFTTKKIEYPWCEACHVGVDWYCVECDYLIESPLKTGKYCLVCYGIYKELKEKYPDLDQEKQWQQDEILNHN